jgi:hypothetical protein
MGVTLSALLIAPLGSVLTPSHIAICMGDTLLATLVANSTLRVVLAYKPPTPSYIYNHSSLECFGTCISYPLGIRAL